MRGFPNTLSYKGWSENDFKIMSMSYKSNIFKHWKTNKYSLKEVQESMKILKKMSGETEKWSQASHIA